MSVHRLDAADVERARRVIDHVDGDSRAADGVAVLDEATRMWLAHDGLTDAALWVGRTDEDDGYDDVDQGFALLRGSSLDLAVAPRSRGILLGTALAEAALAEAPEDVTAWSHGDDPAARRLARRFGFESTRELWVMERAVAPVDVPDTPGVTIRGYGPDDANEVVRVNAAAFSHHAEQGAMDADNLAARMSEAWFDPAGLLVADSGPPEHRLLGFHWTKQHSTELGEVYVVAVDPAAQGRGLGRAVTAAGLEHLAGLGVRRVILYVESDNPAGIATYSHLGFRHTETHVQYARP